MKEPGFGPRLRGYRLGWRWSERHGAMIRMSTNGTANVIELCPPNAIPSVTTKTGYHREWWNTPEILEMLPWLTPIKRIKKYVKVEVDDNGEIIQ